MKRFRQVGGQWNLVSDTLAHLPKAMAADDRIVGRMAWGGPHSSCSRLTGDQVERLGKPLPAVGAPSPTEAQDPEATRRAAGAGRRGSPVPPRVHV